MGAADMVQRPAVTRMVRRPAVAGQFYPADPDQLAESVDAMLAAVEIDGTSAAGGLRRTARRLPLLRADRGVRIRAAAAARRCRPGGTPRARPLRPAAGMCRAGRRHMADPARRSGARRRRGRGSRRRRTSHKGRRAARAGALPGSPTPVPAAGARRPSACCRSRSVSPLWTVWRHAWRAPWPTRTRPAVPWSSVAPTCRITWTRTRQTPTTNRPYRRSATWHRSGSCQPTRVASYALRGVLGWARRTGMTATSCAGARRRRPAGLRPGWSGMRRSSCSY